MSKRKKKRCQGGSKRRQPKQPISTEPECWEAYLNDPIALMQDGEYHLLHQWELRNEEHLYGEDSLVFQRRQAAFWDFDRNDPGDLRYPADYKVENEEPDAFDGGDDDLEQGYRAGYVLKSWGPENEYDGYADWDDEDLF